LSCSRFHQAVEDVFNDVGGTYAFALNRTGADIVRYMETGQNKWQWNMMVHQMIKWMRDARVIDAKLIREALDRQFSNFFLKLVVNDNPSSAGFTDDMDPEIIERALWANNERERKAKEAKERGEEYPPSDSSPSSPPAETDTPTPTSEEIIMTEEESEPVRDEL